MKNIYILCYSDNTIYRTFIIVPKNYKGDINTLVEKELVRKGLNLDEISYMVSDYELMIEEL